MVLKDKAVEAQACYSLGNTYTLQQDYQRAIDYHLKHLIIAQELKDRYTIYTKVCGHPFKLGDSAISATPVADRCI